MRRPDLRLFLIVYAVFFLLCPHPASGQNAPEEEFLFADEYGPEEGLRQSMVSQVYQDPDGILWMVTGDGLHCFDGKEFRCFRMRYNGTVNHSDNLMRNLSGGSPGTLTLASTSSLLNFTIATGKFNIIWRKEGSYPTLFSININGKLFAWLNSGKLALIGQNQLRELNIQYTGTALPPENFYPDYSLMTGKGKLLLANRDGILETGIPGANPDKPIPARWFPVSALQALASDRMGNVFLIAANGLYVYNGEGKKTLIRQTGLKNSQQLFIDSDGNFWISGDSELHHCKTSGGTIRKVYFCVRDGKHLDTISVRIRSIYEDRTKNLWICTENNGLLKYTPRLQRFNRVFTGFTRCLSYFNGKVYAGTFQNGLWELSEDLSSAARVLPGKPGGNSYFLDMITDNSNHLWIATQEGVLVLDSKQRLIRTFSLKCSKAEFLHFSADSIYLATENRLIVFGTGDVPVFGRSAGFTSVNAYLKTSTAQWFGNQFGLFRTMETEIRDYTRIFTTQNRVSYNQINDLLETDHRIWAATGNGIELFSPEGVRQPLPGQLKELENEIIYALANDQHNRIWFSGNNGIGCININTQTVSFFGRESNLQSLEFNSNAVCTSQGGNIYFGGIKGVNGFDPDLFTGNGKKPSVRLISLAVADTLYTEGIPPTGMHLKLSRNAPNLSGSVFSPDFPGDGSLTYSFFLTGYESTWNTPSTDCSFSYRNLPPGNYRLMVKCTTAGMNTSDPQELLTIILDPPFWKTTWFLILLISAISALTAAIVRRFNSTRFREQIKELEQKHAIEKERLRISKDMHDEVGASLTRISILSEVAMNQQQDAARSMKVIGQISEIAGNVVDEMSGIIWSMNPKNDHLDNFAAYIRHYASNYLDTSDIRLRFDFPEEIPSTGMSSELRRNLFLVIKEALHNILKHSGARNVIIGLRISGADLTVSVKDDGSGFGPAAAGSSGNGLHNMRRRIEDSKGWYVLKSGPGEGTEITAHVKLA